MKIILNILLILLFGASCSDRNNKDSVSSKNIAEQKEHQVHATNKLISSDECFKNLINFKSDSTVYKTKNGKLFHKIKQNENFILTCNSDGEMYMRRILTKIDFDSMKQLGEFWLDENNVYGNYKTSDGEMLFKISEANPKTFKIFENSIFGKDNKNIYNIRHGKIKHADLKTFKPIFGKNKTTSVYGKDKSNFFYWDEVVKDTTYIKNQIEFN